MIKSLTLQSFRRHKDLSVEFRSGLNALKSPNEGGKSTIIEACLYAWHGAKGLRTPLSETVTWGHKETDLKVTLVADMGGTVRTWTRSKSGAECNWTGGKVTGHTEVTKFASELLGADVKTASMLMLASQSDLRGSLDEGPSAVSALMGKLADFDLLDRLVDAGAQTLLLGSEDPIRAKLVAAEAELEAATASLPAQADVDAAGLAVAAAEVVLTTAQAATADLQAGVTAANEAVQDAKARAAAHDNAALALASIRRQLDSERSQLDRARVLAADRPDAAEIVRLRDRVAEIAGQQPAIDAYKRFLSLPVYPELFWEGSQEEFYEELADEVKGRDVLRPQVQQLEFGIRNLEKGRVKSGKCPTCGLSALSDEHVRAKNQEIDEQLALQRELLEQQEKFLSVREQTVRQLESLDATARVYASRWMPLAHLLNVDLSFFPPKLSWRGDIPREEPIGPIRAQLSDLEAKERAALQAEGRVTAHTNAVKAFEAQIQAAAERLESLPAVDIEPFKAAFDTAYATYAEAAAAERAAQAALSQARQAVTDLSQLTLAATTRQATVRSRIAEYTQDLKTLAFNNCLIKKLKGMKPLITDHLWNQVLSAVSSFFSALRGEASVVSKNGDGFRVNGQSVDSLSGSTLDVLALAIRVALTKTFVPHASFIVLDEPGAGCDTTRTGNMLGFLASVGFDQIILASHDELSESVASHVIRLGE